MRQDREITVTLRNLFLRGCHQLQILDIRHPSEIPMKTQDIKKEKGDGMQATLSIHRAMIISSITLEWRMCPEWD